MVYFPSDDDWLQKDILSSIFDLTIVCWHRIDATNCPDADYASVWYIGDDGVGSVYTGLDTDNTHTQWWFFNQGGTAKQLMDVSDGVWTFTAFTAVASPTRTLTWYQMELGDTSFTTYSQTTSLGYWGSDKNPDMFYIGEWNGENTPFVGDIVGLKVFTSALSEEACWNEAMRLAPSLTPDHDFPLLNAAYGLLDVGPNRDDMTQGSTGAIQTGDLPPILLERPPRALVHSAAGGASGTLAASLPILTVSFTGTQTFSGALTANLLLLTSSLSGTQTFTGTMATNTLLPTMALTGSSGFVGALAGSLPIPTAASLSGTQTFSGSLAANLLIPTSTNTGTQTFAGALSTSLLLPSQAFTGTQTFSGALSTSLPIPTSTLTGTAGNAGILGASLPIPTAGSFTGTQTFTGTLAPSLLIPATGSFTGTQTFAGVVGANLLLPSMAFTGTAQGLLTGTLAASLPMPNMDAGDFIGSQTFTGAVAASILLPTMALTGSQTFSGSAFAMSLPVPTMDFTAYSVENVGTMAMSLPVPEFGLFYGAETTLADREFWVNVDMKSHAVHNVAAINLGAEGDVSDGVLLQATSTSGGIQFPNMTEAQRDAISPPAGTVIYNTDTNVLNFYNGSSWGAV